MEKRKRGRPLGSGKKAKEEVVAMPLVVQRRVCPPGSKNKKTLAATTAPAVAVSSFVAVAVLGPSMLALALQPPAYSPMEGYMSFLILVLAGGAGRIRMHSKFMETVEGRELSLTVLREGSGEQPPYELEVH
jgi:hypothetical protein